MHAKTYVGIICCLFSIAILKAQTIQGYVFDTMTEEPIPGVTVYFDGTSIGTTTDLNGYFSLETQHKLSSTLLVSYMGYETITVANPYDAALFKIYLKETSFNLDEVVLQADPFSRAEKLEVFRRQFLGYPYKGKCEILNEDAIIVTYNMYTHTLMAMAKEPLQIRNEYLGYDVTYNLIDFKATYNKNTLNAFQLNNVYFSGTSFFEDISTDKNKYVRRRKSAYLGSSLHLIRTMTLQDKLKKDLKKRSIYALRWQQTDSKTRRLLFVERYLRRYMFASQKTALQYYF